MDVTGSTKSLPENAYRKLNPGEQYTPVVPAAKIVPELTPYALVWGVFYAALFSAACAYLGLKIGQVFEAATAYHSFLIMMRSLCVCLTAFWSSPRGGSGTLNSTRSAVDFSASRNSATVLSGISSHSTCRPVS